MLIIRLPTSTYMTAYFFSNYSNNQLYIISKSTDLTNIKFHALVFYSFKWLLTKYLLIHSEENLADSIRTSDKGYDHE